LSEDVVGYWFPWYGHPDGESDAAWFRVVDGWAYRIDANPAGASESPTFRIIEGWAFPTLSLPGDELTFQIVGSFVYAEPGAAWFRVEERDT
jgi:hypothetical protein